MEMEQAKQILDVLDKTAQSSSAKWNGMMKIEGMQESVAGLFGKLGMNPKTAQSLLAILEL